VGQDPRASAGFTLVELLIVIVVLGILAAIAVFAVASMTDHGRVSACAADRHTLETAEEAYFSAHGSYETMNGLVPAFLHQASTLHDITRADGTPMSNGAPDYAIAPASASCTS
jgi:general secretion pathway protein G